MHPLLGRDGLDLIFPGWRKTFSLKSVDKSGQSFDTELKTKFPNVFSESPENAITGLTADIVLKPNTAVLQSVQLLQTPNYPVEHKLSKLKSISTHITCVVTHKCSIARKLHF